jgi:hypothetical protein
MGDKIPKMWYNSDTRTRKESAKVNNDRFLFYTTVPILLDTTKNAGRMARDLYCRRGITPHSFSSRRGLLLSVYAKHHHTLPFAEENDGVILRLLFAFAREWRGRGSILLLIPCSPAAQSFLERARSRLDEDFIIADLPSPAEDPLGCLLQGEKSPKE